MANSSSTYVKVSYRKGLQIITLSRPKSRNAINFEMYTAIIELLNYGASSEEVLFTVVTGEGNFFSSGNDFKIPPNISLEDSLGLFSKMCDVLIDYPKLLIAIVNGPSIGMSFTMLPLFDIVYASKTAYFQAPFSKIGVNAECCSSLTFPRIFGPSKAMEIFSFCQKISVEEALRYGLISEILSPEQLETEIWDRLINYTELSINSMVVSKKLVRDQERELLHKINRKESASLMEIITTEDTIMRIMRQFQSKV